LHDFTRNPDEGRDDSRDVAEAAERVSSSPELFGPRGSFLLILRGVTGRRTLNRPSRGRRPTIPPEPRVSRRSFARKDLAAAAVNQTA
jgi:hypothetical protein